MASAPAIATPRTSRHSPCIGVCQIDDNSGYCLGCARTRTEIGDWMTMSDAERDRVWTALPARHPIVGERMRLLPWTPLEIAEWAAGCIARRAGTWVTGAPGAVAEFTCLADRHIEAVLEGDALTARAADAAMRLRFEPKLRAFAVAEDGPIVLGLPRARATLPVNSAVAALGADANAIEGGKRRHQLFDLGIGRTSSRFCVRTDDSELIALLSANSGRHWSDVMPAADVKILAAGPDRIVESAAARIEVFASPSQPPGSPVLAGAHPRHFPANFQNGEEIAKELSLPEFALPVAIFYPAA